MSNDYVVATVKPWNTSVYRRRVKSLPGKWHLIWSQTDLTIERIRAINPRYIFFPHWSWRVPDEIIQTFECVCFHMTEVPYGRGGSPLQNLILRGKQTTEISALRMERSLDTGPVYLRRPLGLSGRAETIYRCAAEIVFDMIAEIVEREPQPVPQEGEATVFTRREPQQSVLPTTGSLESLFDHIRMLDAPTYPLAFLEHGDFHLEFSHATKFDKYVRARVTFRRSEGDEHD